MDKWLVTGAGRGIEATTALLAGKRIYGLRELPEEFNGGKFDCRTNSSTRWPLFFGGGRCFDRSRRIKII